MSFWKELGGALKGAAGSFVSGAFGIGSSLLNNKAQSDANKMNLKINQMNNDWSEKMMEKQNQMNIAQWQREAEFSKQQTQAANDFTEYMQNKANEFNSAKNQAARLREAGLNPALAMSGNNAGVAQGASGASGSSPSGSSVGLPSPSNSSYVRPMTYDGFASAINNTMQMIMAKEKNDAEIRNLDANTDREKALLRGRIDELMYKNEHSKFDLNMKKLTKDLIIQNMNEDFLAKVQRRANEEQLEKLYEQQVIAQQLINQNLPDKLAMDIAVQASIRDLNKFNADHELGKVISSLEKRGYKLSEQEKKIIFESLKQYIVYAPTKGMSSAGAAATIGNVIGNVIK